ncbi:MAG: FAD-dependent oxidoreductase, partial [Acidimicrobiales bacterium]
MSLPTGRPLARGSPDILVVGGGVIGLSIAWRAALAGLAVLVADPNPGRGATWAAAGLLAPVSEVHYGEEPLLALNMESARRFPSFVEELEVCVGHDIGYRQIGALVVALDRGDAAVLSELHDFHHRLGLCSALIGGKQARALEPMLAPGVSAGLVVEGDHQVD